MDLWLSCLLFARLLAKPGLLSFWDLAGTLCLLSVRTCVELTPLPLLLQVTPHAPPPPDWPIPPPPMGQLVCKYRGWSFTPFLPSPSYLAGAGIIRNSGSNFNLWKFSQSNFYWWGYSCGLAGCGRIHHIFYLLYTYIFKRSPSTASRNHLIQNIFTSSLFDFPSLNAQYLEVQMTVTRSIWGPWSGISQYCDSGRGSKSSDAFAYMLMLTIFV